MGIGVLSVIFINGMKNQYDFGWITLMEMLPTTIQVTSGCFALIVILKQKLLVAETEAMEENRMGYQHTDKINVYLIDYHHNCSD